MLRLLCATLLLAGCRANDLSWEIRFDPPELGDRVVRLDARISRGACPGTETVWNETVFPSSGATTLPELDEGTWCFSALGGDADCNWIAEGSVARSLPTDDTVVVTATEVAPRGSCAGTCDAGVCPTGSSACGGSEDCTDVCASPVCTFRCADAASCAFDCRGHTCDIECVGSSICSADCRGGQCSVACGEGADCDVDCRDGACDLRCGDTADCGFDCSAGTCSFACEGTGTCDTTCTSGICTGP